MTELPKNYEPSAIEQEIRTFWEAGNYFNAKPDQRDQRFCIVIPPPNVTGALHLGHALNNTLQDILVRWHRMRGHNTLWMPGTDHAGIATQAVVEKRLKEEENLTRHDIGREALVDRIWKWKEQYESRIIGQLKLMGASCDFSRTRFTLDEGCSQAVRTTFYKLFKDGVVFRGKRLVNWDCELQTAVADDEVYHENVKGKFYHFRYPLAADSIMSARKAGISEIPDYLVIATTRPETMLGDTAVAVHPNPETVFDKQLAELEDELATAIGKEQKSLSKKIEALQERREALLPQLQQLAKLAVLGTKLDLPLCDRQIPLITDDWADPTKGSGCVKITPAHDPNDYEVGERHHLKQLNILNPDGTINHAGGAYTGLDRFEARKRIVADLEQLGLVEQIEDHVHDVGHSDRSKSPVEPYLSDQWFVKMDTTLTDRTLEAVQSDDVRFHPRRYKHAYLDWLSERRDWCISRQLWWGHRIPVWTSSTSNPDESSLPSELRRAIDEDRLAYQYFQHGDRPGGIHAICLATLDSTLVSQLSEAGFVQESDVLDTWFSSALWPHSTLGWPEADQDLEYYYPTTVLITSRDIITLWVVRMVFTGLYNLDQKPFEHVYVHPKILDGFGITMSKSKGNGVDPLDIIEAFGADALRFGIAAMTTETQDIRMPVEYLCPHCQKLVPQTKQNRWENEAQRIPSKSLQCKECNRSFATRWADDSTQQELGLAYMVSDKFEAARNFTNKLWNAARFAFMNLDSEPPQQLDLKQLPTEDRWILDELARVVEEVDVGLNQYHYARMTLSARNFFWDKLCDWYLEIIKYRFQEDHHAAAARQILAICLDQILRLLHPIVPFITERLWRQLNEIAPQRGLPGILDLPYESALTISPYPVPSKCNALRDDQSCRTFADLQDAVRSIREVRATTGMAPKQPVTVSIETSTERCAALESEAHILKRLANVGELKIHTATERPKSSAIKIVGHLKIFVHDCVDDDQERKRISKEVAALKKRAMGIEGKLNNDGYVKSAPPEMVQETREILSELQTELRTLDEVQTLLAS